MSAARLAKLSRTSLAAGAGAYFDFTCTYTLPEK